MIAVGLALVAAITYGLSDFVGGISGRRASVWSVAVVAGLAGGLVTALAALLGPGSPTGENLLWGAIAGLGNGFGTGFLYRGLATGRMGVVSPVSGVTAAALPVVVGVASGERPAALVWAGILVALPAIWLVAREPGGTAPSGSGLVDGLVAGLGFGGMFAALAQVPESAGYWPLTLNQLVGIITIVGIATTLRNPWLPRDPAAAGGAVAGVLGGLATLGFLVATHHGFLAVTAVLTSLYPAGTVLLAALVLRERVHRSQGAGLALCAVSVVCVALG